MKIFALLLSAIEVEIVLIVVFVIHISVWPQAMESNMILS